MAHGHPANLLVLEVAFSIGIKLLQDQTVLAMFRNLLKTVVQTIVDLGVLGLEEAEHSLEAELAKDQTAQHTQKVKLDVLRKALLVADPVLEKPHLEEAVRLQR
jgi:uracil phosphoribosyltransferase